MDLEVEFRWQHAYDADRLLIQGEDPAHHIRIAPKLPLPESVGQQCHRGSSGAILSFKEGPPHRRAYTQEIEKIGGCQAYLEARSPAGSGELRPRPLERSHAVEDGGFSLRSETCGPVTDAFGMPTQSKESQMRTRRSGTS